jgi:ketosteroid isomerase-like protein
MHAKHRLLIVPVFVAAVAVLGLSGSGTSATIISPHADSVAVAKTVHDFHDALSKGDSAAVLRLLSSDAVILESGSVESRSEYRSHHLPSDIEFAKAVAEKRGPLQVSVKGAVAWTAGTSVSKGEFRGRAIDSTGAESMVLTKEISGWRIRSIHWSSRRRTTSS